MEIWEANDDLFLFEALHDSKDKEKSTMFQGKIVNRGCGKARSCGEKERELQRVLESDPSDCGADGHGEGLERLAHSQDFPLHLFWGDAGDETCANRPSQAA